MCVFIIDVVAGLEQVLWEWLNKCVAPQQMAVIGTTDICDLV